MRAVIICGGAITDYEYIKRFIQEDDTVICADSGFLHAAEMQLTVDSVVGDFDSLMFVPEGIKAVRYPAEKNFTDTEIALAHARERGFRRFLIIAGTGNRIDHTLANILLLKDCLDRDEEAVIIDEHNKIMITRSRLKLHEKAGSIVSLIPLTDCFGVTTYNLKYPLVKAQLSMGKAVGVSNIMTDDEAAVSIEAGTILVIVARD